MKLELKRIRLRLAHPWRIARTSGTDEFRVVVVQLTDENGLSGRGEAAPVARYMESEHSVEQFLRQLHTGLLSFGNIPASMEYLDSVAPGNQAAKCAVNVALVDGAAKHAQQPIYDFVGLGFQEWRHVTSFTIGIDEPKVIRDKVLAADRFPILKMKVGGPSDRANLAALREVAPKKPVRVDANEGWRTKEQALDMIEWLARDGNIQFVEQPLPASTPVHDWVWLKKRSPLPIFGDESYHVAPDSEFAVACFHGVNVKLAKTGGITAARDALQVARRLGLKTMLGCMIESSLLISAAAHLAGLCDYLDLDGNLLITNDPYVGVSVEKGFLSFAGASEKTGLRVSPRRPEP